jgi:hypothetical protein
MHLSIKLPCTLAFLACSFASTSLSAMAANWEGVFEGTIGKSKVIVELKAGEEHSSFKGGYREGARYSYVPKARDINLVLDQEGTQLRFTETLWPHHRFADEADKKITGKWQLKVSDDSAAGTWTSPDGKKSLPIALERVDLLSQRDKPADDNVLSATYDLLWVANVSFSDAGPAATFGNVEVRFSKDSAFGIAFPLLGQFPDGNRKAKANELLLSQHLKSVVDYRNCMNGVPTDWQSENAEPEFGFKVDYATETVLSVTESGSVFCGGAHPNNYVTPHSFDLATPVRLGGDALKDLEPDHFGRLLKLSNSEERAAFETFALGKWQAAAANDADLGKDCATGWLEEAKPGERDFHLSFVPTGLAITRTDFPHVASVCKFTDFNPTIIPWADLKPWLKSDQTLLSKELR